METKTFKTFIKEIKKGGKTYTFIKLWCKDSNNDTIFYTLRKTPSKECKEMLKQLAQQRGALTLLDNQYVECVEEKEINGIKYTNNYIDLVVNIFLPF